MTDLPIGLILLASQETSLLTLDTFMGLESCAADPQNQCLRRLRMPSRYICNQYKSLHKRLPFVLSASY